MKIKINKHEYTGNSYLELLGKILKDEPNKIQREIVEKFKGADINKILSSENKAQEIWDDVFCWHSELKLMEALPRAYWFKIVYEDEFGEENFEFHMAVNAAQAIKDFNYSDVADECKKFRVVQLTSREVKKLAMQDEISRFMVNGCTKAEAVRHIKEGSISILAADWNEWAVENDYTDEDGKVITLDQMRDSKDDGVSIITAPNGGEYVLLYVL